MNETIHRYAIDKVWCAPSQDNSVIIRPALISPRAGSGNVTTVMGRRLPLPTTTGRYDVYQVGLLYPSVLGLDDYNPAITNEHWQALGDSVTARSLLVQVYNYQGIELPKSCVYYCFTKERNLIFCIKRLPVLKIEYPQLDVYFRFYTNAFYSSDRANLPVDGVVTKSTVATSIADITSFGSLLQTYKAKEGYALCYVNGMLRHDISLATAVVGDTLEFIYDSSIKKLVKFNLKDLQSFNSTLDDEYKYLMTYNDTNNGVIDFEDDVDFWVTHKDPMLTNGFSGLYLGRNTPESIRMVTHREYSIKVHDVQRTKNYLRDLLGLTAILDENTEVLLIVRKAGFDRTLVKDSSRLFELFKLPYRQRMSAIIGENASMPEWRAADLESSQYLRLMREEYSNISMELVQDAFGYSGVAKLLFESPLKAEVHSSVSSCVLAPGLQVNSTAVEYDFNGHLLDIVNHISGERYYSAGTVAKHFELFAGLNSESPSVTFSSTEFLLEENVEFRLYRTRVVAGVWQEQWEDVTELDLYTKTNNSITIQFPSVDYMYMLRTSKVFLARSFDLQPVGGNFYFSLTERVNRGVGLFDHFVHVPPKTIKVFLNRKPLIEGIDYKVIFPQVYIFSKKHLVNPFVGTNQRIDFICHGFCDDDCKYNPQHDTGFVEHGMLSNDAEYDLRDDKLITVTIDGASYHPQDVVFSELNPGTNTVNPLNGKPFQVSSIDAPLWGLENITTTEFRRRSKLLDQKVKENMTQLAPQDDRGDIMVINSKYELFSPFFQKIIFDLLNNNILEATIEELTSDSSIMHFVANYNYLLKFDPLTENNRLDERFVSIHPHCWPVAVSLSRYKYEFLVKIVRLFGKSKIDLTSFVSISS